MQVLVYVEASGRCPFRNWFVGLDPHATTKITIALTRLEQGNLSNAKAVGAGVFEYRVDFGPGYRVLGATAKRLSSCWVAEPSKGKDKTSRRHTSDGQTINGAGRDRIKMPLTRSFKDMVKERVERDPKFRAALFTEAVQQLLAGDVKVGKAVLRDYINATVGFERLARETGTPAKSLMRMFGPKGNPRADNLFAVISRLQKASGIRLGVAVGR
jgi:putative addiction module killer protein